LGTRDPLTHIFENVWQIKDFKSCVFGSVANAGVRSEKFRRVARKGLK
jgi:hypothetical protein